MHGYVMMINRRGARLSVHPYCRRVTGLLLAYLYFMRCYYLSIHIYLCISLLSLFPLFYGHGGDAPVTPRVSSPCLVEVAIETIHAH